MTVPFERWTEPQHRKVTCGHTPADLRAAMRAAVAQAVGDMVDHLDLVIMIEERLGQRLTYTLPGGMRVRWTLTLEQVADHG